MSRAAAPSRRAQRRAAAFLLYQLDLRGGELEELLDAYRRDHGEDATAFTRRRVEETWAARERLDGQIDAVAQGWTASRMAVLERNVLRLAVWELDEGEVPPAVVIDEAVATAKRYASPEAAVLVNGILGRLARERGVGR